MPPEWLISQGIGVAVAVMVLVGAYRLGSRLVGGLLKNSTLLVQGILGEMNAMAGSITETNSKLSVLLDRSTRASEQAATAATYTAQATKQVAEVAERVEKAVGPNGGHDA